VLAAHSQPVQLRSWLCATPCGSNPGREKETSVANEQRAPKQPVPKWKDEKKNDSDIETLRVDKYFQ
jgi:hypothetical protein